MSANAAKLHTTVNTTITRTGRRYRVRYWVTTTEASDQGLQALTASGLPSRGDYYVAGDNADLGAFWDGYDTRLADEEGHRKFWEVLVDFSSMSSRADPRSPPNRVGYDYPWNEPSELRGHSRVSEKQVDKHYSNPTTGTKEAIKNSFGDPRKDEYREFSHATLVLRKKYHVNSWSPSAVKPYIDTLNASSFFGEAAHYYRFEAPLWSLEFTGEGVAFWDVEYSFAGDEEGWNGKDKVDEGQRYWDADNSEVRRFEDDKFLPYGDTGPLDGEGGKLERWANLVLFPSGGINHYRTAEWGNLPIPTTVYQILQGY